MKKVVKPRGKVYTVCKGKKSADKRIQYFLEISLTAIDVSNGLSQVYCIKPEGRIH